MKKRMSILQMRNANRSMLGLPNVGDIRRGFVVVSVTTTRVMAVPKEKALKFTLEEWSEMAGKEEVR